MLFNTNSPLKCGHPSPSLVPRVAGLEACIQYTVRLLCMTMRFITLKQCELRGLLYAPPDFGELLQLRIQSVNTYIPDPN